MKIFRRKNKDRENLQKVLAFGTFDVFHPGHTFYLKKAKKLGDYLVVVVARDETAEKIKGKMPEQNEELRMEKVKQNCTADEVVLGSSGDRFEVLEKFRPSVIALGYDQDVDEEDLLKKLAELELECQIKRVRAFKPEIYKSSKLKKEGEE